jgi:hypothetical protein
MGAAHGVDQEGHDDDDDDDDVDRIYRGTSERQVQVADASLRFRDPPYISYAMRSAPTVYFRPRLALSRSIHVDRGETTRSKEGDDIRSPITVR